MAELNLTSAVPHTDCGTGRQRGRIGWLIAAGILAAALLWLLVLRASVAIKSTEKAATSSRVFCTFFLQKGTQKLPGRCLRLLRPV